LALHNAHTIIELTVHCKNTHIHIPLVSGYRLR